MGLDMRPMGKPLEGYEEGFEEIYRALIQGETPQPGTRGASGKNGQQTREELLAEWFSIQIPSYETIEAPMVGRDQEAMDWIMQKYSEMEPRPPLDDFLQTYNGYYVIELAKQQDGVPVYRSLGQDENVFRGQFLVDCIDLVGADLVSEAWNSKLSSEALDYGNRLMAAALSIAGEHSLEYLQTQRDPPDLDEEAIESKLHILFSLARWLMFYGSNGHGYEADY